MSTPTFDAMKQVVTAAAPMLKAAGFRKRRHSFNRSVADGSVHVVDFQMGSYDPSGRPDVLVGIQVNFHGLFTINLGVFVPEMDRMGSPRSSWINDPDCQLRMRIGGLLPEPADVWWPLDAETSQSSAIEALHDLGLTWLDHFPDRQSVIDMFYAGEDDVLGFEGPAELDMADLLLAIGNVSAAEELVRGYLARPDLSRLHREYIETEYLAMRNLRHLTR